jgi:hypothetical protein
MTTPMSQLAKVYQLLESHLRRAASTNKPFSIAELNSQGDLAAIIKSTWQVRDILNGLSKRNFVNIIKDGNQNRYTWNLNAPPFIMRLKDRKMIDTQPSRPELTTFNESKRRVVTPAKEIELVVGKTLIVVCRNVITGRLRIVIEDVD